MSLVFYKVFSTSQIGLLSGGLGTLTCAMGSFINGYGLFRGIVVGGIAMAATNLLFALLAHYPYQWLLHCGCRRSIHNGGIHGCLCCILIAVMRPPNKRRLRQLIAHNIGGIQRRTCGYAWRQKPPISSREVFAVNGFAVAERFVRDNGL